MTGGPTSEAGAGRRDATAPPDGPVGVDPTAGDVACTLTEAEAKQRAEWVDADVLPYFEALEERADGYAMRFARTSAAFEAVTELVRLESDCCGDFHFQVDVPPGADTVTLTVTGPDGTKALIERGLLDRFECLQ